ERRDAARVIRLAGLEARRVVGHALLRAVREHETAEAAEAVAIGDGAARRSAVGASVAETGTGLAAAAPAGARAGAARAGAAGAPAGGDDHGGDEETSTSKRRCLHRPMITPRAGPRSRTAPPGIVIISTFAGA